MVRLHFILKGIVSQKNRKVKQTAKEALEKARETEAAAMEEAKKAVSEETERIRKVALSRETEAIHAIIDGLY